MRVATGAMEPDRWVPGKTILFNPKHPYDCRVGLLYVVQASWGGDELSAPSDEPILKVVYGRHNHLSSNGYQSDLEKLGWVEIGKSNFPIESQ